MKKELNKLYEYCKSKGYNESIEKFEEDLSQLIVEELGSEELSKVSGGEKGINALTAGVISALSIASPLVSAAGASGFNSGVGKTTGALPPAATVKVVNKAAYNKATPKSSDSKDTLKNILIGVLGLGVTGAVAGDIGLGVALAKAKKNKPKPEPVEEVGDFEKNVLKFAQILDKYMDASLKILCQCYDDLKTYEKYEFFNRTSWLPSNVKLIADIGSIENSLMSLGNKEYMYKSQTLNFRTVIAGLVRGETTTTEEEKLKFLENNRISLVAPVYQAMVEMLALSNNNTILSYVQKYNIQIGDIVKKIIKEKDEAAKNGKLFYNNAVVCESPEDSKIYTFSNADFSRSLDVCAEFLNDCPIGDNLRPIVFIPPTQLSSFRLQVLKSIKETYKKLASDRMTISAANIADHLKKDQKFIQDLKNGIILGNSHVDPDSQQVGQGEGKLKWNYVGALMSIAIGQNGDPADDRNDANWYYITKKIPNAGGLISQCISCINSAKQTEESEQQSVSINWPVAAEPTEVQLSIRDDGTSHSGDEESKSDDDSATTETSSEE